MIPIDSQTPSHEAQTGELGGQLPDKSKGINIGARLTAIMRYLVKLLMGSSFFKIKPVLYQKTPWIILLVILGLMLMVVIRWDSFESGRRFQVTNNAYTHFDNTIIEAKISGYVKEVAFSDFQPLAQSDLLVVLEDEEYKLAEIQAAAKLRHATSLLDNLSLEENLQKAYVEQAKAAADKTETRLNLAQRDYQRLANLGRRGSVANTEVETAETDLKASQASHQENEALLIVQERKLELLTAERAIREADVAEAEAAWKKAGLDLSYTRLTAPVKSTAGACKIRAGELVKVGTQIVTLVPDRKPHVIANYKETQLTNIQIGQSVDLTIDTYPGRLFKGVVAGISPGTGAAFSLMANDNTSGNFTKVVQRIPVRIEFVDPLEVELRAGMSVETKIDTGSDQ